MNDVSNTTNPFDFSNTEDLPETIAKKLASKSGNVSTAARDWANVVAAGAKAGYSALTIGQIMAAAHRMGMKVPADQTVRNYLNAAVTDGLIVKPSQQTYAVPAKGSKAEAIVSEDAVVWSAPVADEADILADLT